MHVILILIGICDDESTKDTWVTDLNLVGKQILDKTNFFLVIIKACVFNTAFYSHEINLAAF